jgi:hypothetical protein
VPIVNRCTPFGVCQNFTYIEGRNGMNDVYVKILHTYKEWYDVYIFLCMHGMMYTSFMQIIVRLKNIKIKSNI